MAGFDTTDVAAHVTVANPLQQLGQIAETRNALNQLQLFPQQLQQAQTTTLALQQKLQTERMAALQAALASTGSDAEVPGVYHRFISAGLIDPETAANAVGGNIDSLSPGRIHELRQQALLNSGNANELEREFGTPTPVGTGAGTQFENINRYTGNVERMSGPSGGFVPNALSPTEMASPVATVDENGTQSRHTLGEFVNADGTPKAGVTPPIIALGPLSANAQASLGAAYGPQIAAFENSAPQIAAGRQAVENLRTEGDQFAAGPQSDFWKHLGEFASEYGIHLVPPASPGETAAREAYAKNLTMILSAQQKTLHMDATDAARQTAELSVPSEMTTPEGRNRALAVIEGNLDAQSAMLKVWEQQKVKGGVASWGPFQVEFPAKVPLSIFQAQFMSAPEIAAMQKDWSAAKKADWQRRYDLAKKQGWLPNAE